MEIPITDGKISFFPAFFHESEANALFGKLKEDIAWEQRHIRLFGKSFPQPRLTAWYGDTDKGYTYSGISWEARPWTPELLAIKAKIESASQCSFNSVLLNLYRNEKDSMGWHSDDEAELGNQPIIASVSFGQARKFHLRHRFDAELKPVHLELTHGSLLIMWETVQTYWKHQLPKSRRKMEPRINLTFRFIQ